MKKILLFLAALLMLAACHKEPFRDSDNEYLVFTSPGKDVDFTQYKTFHIADSLLVIGLGKDPQYSDSREALELISAFQSNMQQRGFVYTPNASEADLGIQLTYIVRTERFISYYDTPYWWLDYPGYWSPGYWGNWNGYYYPRPVTYVRTSSALLSDIVDLTPDLQDDEPIEILWSSYIGGPSGSSYRYDLKRLQTAINQAFTQSSYLAPAPEAK